MICSSEAQRGDPLNSDNSFWCDAVQAIPQAYVQLAAQTRRDELILNHLALVRHVAGRLTAELPPGVDLENIESAGTLGLVEAASTFDPERGIKFETYAYNRVKGAMIDELRRNCPLPQQILQLLARIRKAYEELQPPVSLEKLSSAVGVSTDEVVDCLAAARLTRLLTWDSSTELRAPQRTSGQPMPDDVLELAELKDLLAQGIESLPERERTVVTLYYLEELRLKEIGQVVGLSESRVSRVLNAGLFALREFVRARAR